MASIPSCVSIPSTEHIWYDKDSNVTLCCNTIEVKKEKDEEVFNFETVNDFNLTLNIKHEELEIKDEPLTEVIGTNQFSFPINTADSTTVEEIDLKQCLSDVNDVNICHRRKLLSTRHKERLAHHPSEFFNNYIQKATEENDFICGLCEYRTTKKDRLQVHVRTHSGEKPFACILCGHKANRKSNLQLHMRTHTGEKRFRCRLCDYKANAKSSLDAHVFSHTGEKPFTCDLCDYRGKRKSCLKAHMRIHSEKKSLSCNLCDYNTNDKSCLRRHMLTHTGEKPFACNLCSYKGTRKSYLQAHMNTHIKRK